MPAIVCEIGPGALVSVRIDHRRRFRKLSPVVAAPLDVLRPAVVPTLRWSLRSALGDAIRSPRPGLLRFTTDLSTACGKRSSEGRQRASPFGFGCVGHRSIDAFEVLEGGEIDDDLAPLAAHAHLHPG